MQFCSKINAHKLIVKRRFLTARYRFVSSVINKKDHNELQLGLDGLFCGVNPSFWYGRLVARNVTSQQGGGRIAS